MNLTRFYPTFGHFWHPNRKKRVIGARKMPGLGHPAKEIFTDGGVFRMQELKTAPIRISNY
jgi:hypothetical protein